MIRRLWPFLTAGCILVAAAAAHGLRTDRWGASPDVKAAADRLDTLPLRIGDWEGEAVAIPPGHLAASNAAGITTRRYTHRYTRAEVTAMVVCGRPGPVAVHTPDVCYQGAGFVPGPAQAQPLLDGSSAWVADFKKGGPEPVALRIRWAWNDGRGWTASGSPRTEFARSKVLYKLYLVRPVPHGGDPTPPELDLAKELLPALQAVIAPPQ